MATDLRTQPDHDDPFAATRMPFTAHLEELRWRLWRAIAGLAVGMLVSIPAGEYVLQLIAEPVTAELERFHLRRILRAQERLAAGDPVLVEANQPRPVRITLPRRDLPGGDPADEGAITLTVQIQPVEFFLELARAERLVNHPPALSTLSVGEAFMVYFKVCLYCGVVLASPWVFYQLWSFVAAGLYPHERHLVRYYLPFSLGLFLAGVLVCEFLVMPSVVAFLLGFNESIGLEPDLRLSEWLGFALMMPLVFGAAFQTPVLMLFFNRLGILSASWYRQNRRLAFLALAVIAAVLTAGPDPVSMLMLTLPLWCLYELGILLCRPDPEEISCHNAMP